LFHKLKENMYIKTLFQFRYPTSLSFMYSIWNRNGTWFLIEPKTDPPRVLRTCEERRYIRKESLPNIRRRTNKTINIFLLPKRQYISSRFIASDGVGFYCYPQRDKVKIIKLRFSQLEQFLHSVNKILSSDTIRFNWQKIKNKCDQRPCKFGLYYFDYEWLLDICQFI
jgi:hypothetical protein